MTLCFSVMFNNLHFLFIVFFKDNLKQGYFYNQYHSLKSLVFHCVI